MEIKTVVGYIGKKEAKPILIKGLKRLECFS
jgi:glucosamine 6-phosphate synthetase-like amidotransferase/phosphosugar isomerase protein